ncbi:MAG: hypothetical protein CME36_09545 [unclassified Hahellaceae]|nr:hypothetical protein [Hahellaceae bacterium]|tara:strand:- start:16300 stop:16731 length:432 start_codon:yes stop_codon:yes gene_type:complete
MHHLTLAHTTQEPIHSTEAAVEQYLGARTNLQIAKQIMAEAEAALIDVVGAKPEGSQTFTIADRYKVTTTGKINRALDPKAWAKIAQEIPEPLAKRLVKYKPALDLKEFRFIESNEPDYFRLISSAVTSKPAKASVKVDVVED